MSNGRHRRRRRFIICRQKNLFMTPRPLVSAPFQYDANFQCESRDTRVTMVWMTAGISAGDEDIQFFFFFLLVRDASKCTRDSSSVQCTAGTYFEHPPSRQVSSVRSSSLNRFWTSKKKKITYSNNNNT